MLAYRVREHNKKTQPEKKELRKKNTRRIYKQKNSEMGQGTNDTSRYNTYYNTYLLREDGSCTKGHEDEHTEMQGTKIIEE